MRVFLSHASADTEVARGIASLLGAMVDGLNIEASSLPGRVPEGGDQTLAGLKQQLADTDVVVALITPTSVTSSEVPFQLGAAWALGRRLLLLLDPEGSAELYLPMGHAESLVLGPDTLLELARGFAADVGGEAELGERAMSVLATLYPDYAPADASIPTQAVPAAPAPRDALPTSGASYRAGRAVGDCVYHCADGGSPGTELDAPFGGFLSALGGNWDGLRHLDDLDVWLEAADNMLDSLGPQEQHVRGWYELGYQLSTLLNLAGEDPDAQRATERQQHWMVAETALHDAARAVGIGESPLGAIGAMLANLSGPIAERDYTNVGRVQTEVDSLVHSSDG